MLEGELTVFFDDEDGNRASTKLRKYDAVSRLSGIPHFTNEGEDANDHDRHRQARAC